MECIWEGLSFDFLLLKLQTYLHPLLTFFSLLLVERKELLSCLRPVPTSGSGSLFFQSLGSPPWLISSPFHLVLFHQISSLWNKIIFPQPIFSLANPQSKHLKRLDYKCFPLPHLPFVPQQSMWLLFQSLLNGMTPCHPLLYSLTEKLNLCL